MLDIYAMYNGSETSTYLLSPVLTSRFVAVLKSELECAAPLNLLTFMQEVNFMLGGMDIDVDRVGRNGEAQIGKGMSTFGQKRPVDVAQGFSHTRTIHQPASNP